MFNLTLDIDYMVAALVILITLYVFSKGKYAKVSRANEIFYYMLLCAIVTCVIDIVMNIIITYPEKFPPFVYMLFRLGFNVGTSTIALLGYEHARMYQGHRKNRLLMCLDMCACIPYLIYIILSVVNMFTGIIAYLDDNGVYTHGPLFLLNTIIPVIIFLSMLLVLETNRNDYTKSQRRSLVLNFVLTFLFVGIELATKNVAPLSMFGISISLVVIQQSLLSPEYKKLEEANRIQAQLLVETEAARDDAVAAKKEADEANKAKSSFLARMSHEIRTPLNAVIGFNTIISEEDSNESMREYASNAKKAGENLLGLINDILDFSKIESGKLEIIEDDFRLYDLINEEYQMFRFRAEKKSLDLIFDIDEKLPSVIHGDDIRIRQIITNILSNAVKYTEKGSITLKVTLEKIENAKSRIRYEVTDTGMGIKEKDLGLLFDAFERIEEKRNRRIEGTGLGVNICASLLSMMGSKLEVKSEYGKGSTFWFVLENYCIDSSPIGVFDSGHHVSKADSNTDKKPDMIVAENAHVLVVDDTPMNLKVFKGLLRKSKINIDTAGGGVEALSLTLKNKYDVIFMDHLMPEMDGIEALAAIRTQTDGLNTDTPVIALTANAIKGAREEYLGYGFATALFKPIVPAELNKVLRNYLPDESSDSV